MLASDIAASALGRVMRSSTWAYPAANIAHLFGLALLAGGIMAVDLRIIGLWRRLPLKALSEALTPFAIAGLVIFALSGAAMFAADATALIENPVFLAKIAIVGVAVLNAFAFRRSAGRSLERWVARAPLRARSAAVFSLMLWTMAIILGRMIAYQ